MCSGVNCKIKHKCYRFTATPSEYRQSYFMSPPIKDGRCNQYWSNKNIEK